MKATRGSMMRAVASLIAVAAVTGLSVLPAVGTNTPSPGPTSVEPGYPPTLPPSLNLRILTPICDNDVPYLQYAVEVVGSTDTTVDITFINPGGGSVPITNQPLSGRVLWPGAVVDSSGNPLDWPGWTFNEATGLWEEGDEFDWVRPQVSVLFAVNPEATVTVGYPPSSPNCNPNPENPPSSSGGGGLAWTGMPGGPALLGGAAVLVLTGAGLTIASRRRARHTA